MAMAIRCDLVETPSLVVYTVRSTFARPVAELINAGLVEN